MATAEARPFIPLREVAPEDLPDRHIVVVIAMSSLKYHQKKVYLGLFDFVF